MFPSFWKSLDPTIQGAVIAVVLAVVSALGGLIVAVLNAAKARIEHAAKTAAIETERYAQDPRTPDLDDRQKLEMAVNKFRTGRFAQVPESEAKAVIEKVLPDAKAAFRESQSGLHGAPPRTRN